MADDKNEMLSAADFGLDDDGSDGQPDMDALLNDITNEASDDDGEASMAAAMADEKKAASPATNPGNSNLGMIMDVPLSVSVELGRTRMLVNDLLQLGQGSVIELDKTAGEPMEVLVNDKLVAYGEVVVINERFGVRLTRVIASPALSLAAS